MPFLIQGFFFQYMEGLDIAFKPIEGAIAVVRSGTFQHMYAGAIWEEAEDDPGSLTGAVTDHFGHAILSEIHISDDLLRFTKKYEKRGDPIQYNFRRDGNSWIGTWEGPLVGKGLSRCMLTQVDDSFFVRESIIAALERA